MKLVLDTSSNDYGWFGYAEGDTVCLNYNALLDRFPSHQISAGIARVIRHELMHIDGYSDEKIEFLKL